MFRYESFIAHKYKSYLQHKRHRKWAVNLHFQQIHFCNNKKKTFAQNHNHSILITWCECVCLLLSPLPNRKMKFVLHLHWNCLWNCVSVFAEKLESFEWQMNFSVETVRIVQSKNGFVCSDFGCGLCIEYVCVHKMTCDSLIELSTNFDDEILYNSNALTKSAWATNSMDTHSNGFLYFHTMYTVFD